MLHFGLEGPLLKMAASRRATPAAGHQCTPMEEGCPDIVRDAHLRLESPHVPLPTALRNAARALGLLADPGVWIDPAEHVLLCSYPRSARALAALQGRGIRSLVNLHARSHRPDRLAHYGLIERHVPVPDFAAPTLAQLTNALNAIHAAVRAGRRVAVHCGGGLGRSGTVVACYLVDLGWDWRSALAAVRAVRPGAIETRAQVAAIAVHGDRQKAI